MLIKCSICNIEKEDIEFNRVKGKCNPCCYFQEYNKIKEMMGHPETGELVYLKKVILSKAKKRSKKKGLEFDLTLSDLISLKNNTCPILGCEILYKSGIDHKRSASLDRIDPTKGYIISNVKIVSHEGNSLKNRNNFHSAVKMLEYIITNSPPEDMAPEKKDQLLNLLKDF